MLFAIFTNSLKYISAIVKGYCLIQYPTIPNGRDRHYTNANLVQQIDIQVKYKDVRNFRWTTLNVRHDSFPYLQMALLMTLNLIIPFG